MTTTSNQIDNTPTIIISRAGISDWIWDEHLRGLDDEAAEELLDSFMDALTDEPNIAESKRNWFVGQVCRYDELPDDDDTTAWEAFEPILERVYDKWAAGL